MADTKKNSSKRSAVKRVKNKAIIVTKSKSAKTSPFAKKIRAMNRLLEKAMLLP